MQVQVVIKKMLYSLNIFPLRNAWLNKLKKKIRKSSPFNSVKIYESYLSILTIFSISLRSLHFSTYSKEMCSSGISYFINKDLLFCITSSCSTILHFPVPVKCDYYHAYTPVCYTYAYLTLLKLQPKRYFHSQPPCPEDLAPIDKKFLATVSMATYT